MGQINYWDEGASHLAENLIKCGRSGGFGNHLLGG